MWFPQLSKGRDVIEEFLGCTEYIADRGLRGRTIDTGSERTATLVSATERRKA